MINVTCRDDAIALHVPVTLFSSIVLVCVLGCGSQDSSTGSTDGLKDSVTQRSSNEREDPDRASTRDPEQVPGRELSGRDHTQGGSRQRPPEPNTVDRADALIESGDFAAAEKVLMNLTLVDPDDVMVLFRLANVKAARGQLSEAVDLLEAIPGDDPQAGLPALGQAADWCMELGLYEKSEQKYRQILADVPDAAPAHRQLAYLYNRQGRRHEAATHIRELCKLGNIQQDELQSLIVLSDAMYDSPPSDGGLGPHAEQNPRPYWPIGNLAIARRLLNQRRFDDAVETLRGDVRASSVLPATMAFYGRCAVEAQDVAEVHWWLGHVNESAKDFADYWAALGAYYLGERRNEDAVRVLGEALRRDGTDLISRGRLHQALLVLGQKDLAAAHQQRWLTTRDALNASNRIADSPQGNADATAELADNLLALDRNLEAVLWKTVEGTLRNVSQQTLLNLNQQRLTLVQSDRAFPNNVQKLCGLDINQYPVPDVRQEFADETENALSGQLAFSSVESVSSVESAEIRLENVAPSVGLEHRFSVASKPQPSGFSLYQILGSAVVAFDYDLDGAVDLYLGQGGSDAPTFVGELSNVLYRKCGPATVGRIRSIVDAQSTVHHRRDVG